MSLASCIQLLKADLAASKSQNQLDIRIEAGIDRQVRREMRAMKDAIKSGRTTREAAQRKAETAAVQKVLADVQAQIDAALKAEAPKEAKKAPLYASRPVANAAAIIEWARSQGFETTLPADDLHVTVAYSQDPMDGKAAGKAGPSVTIAGGKRSVEPLGDGGAIVLKFASDDLQGRWQEYRDAGASWDHDGYTPHITLTYDGKGIDLSKVKPYDGPIELGAERQEALNLDKKDEYKEVPTDQPATLPVEKERPTAEAPAKEAAKAEPKPLVQDEALKPLTNFGEELPPSRRTPKLDSELSDDEIATKPLSEIWPAAENESIQDPFAAAVAHAARAEIPAKPRKTYRLKSWVATVKDMRGMAAAIARGDIARDQWIKLAATRPALAGFLAKVKLLEQLDRADWKRVERVTEAPNAYKIDDGKQTATPMVAVTIDGRPHWIVGSGDVTNEETLGHVKALLSAKPSEEKKLQFEIRHDRNGNYFINKKGDPEYRKLMTFSSAEDARTAMKDRYDGLVAAWDAIKARDNVSERDVRGEENRPRRGEDYRGGKDATPEMFTEAFGFRGVEFGKWVTQGVGSKDRQGLLNQAFDGLMDLARILGIPPRAISLDGTLGLAFGSRGHGWASAHYEPDNLVINLTKTRGAGTLGHEWFHALDNHFALRRGKPTMRAGMSQEDYRKLAFITYKPEPLFVHKTKRSLAYTAAQLESYRNSGRGGEFFAAENWVKDPKHPQGVRPEVEERFADVVRALNESPMTKRARALDKGSSDYWSRVIEVAARSFENYLIAKMMEQGFHNDHLANVTAVEDFSRAKERYPYLLPEEVGPVKEAFDGLFAEFQARETEKGTTLFKRGQQSGMPESDVRSVIDRITQGFANPPEVVVVDGLQDRRVPQAVREADAADRARGATGEVSGFFLGGKVYINARAMRSEQEVATTYAHEALGHAGLRGLYGSALDSILDYIIAGRIQEVRAKAKDLGHGEGRQALRRAAEEVLAELAQSKPNLNVIRRLIAAVNEWLRARGFNLKLADSELIRDFIAPARGFIERGTAAEADGAVPAFQRVWHGSPHRGIEKFSTDKIGTGEGAQAFGYGLYFASKKEIAEHYRNALSAGEFMVDGKPAANPNQEMAALLLNLWGKEKARSEVDNPTGDVKGDRPAVLAELDKLLKADSKIEKVRGQLYEVSIPEDSEMLHWDRPLSEQPKGVRAALNLSRWQEFAFRPDGAPRNLSGQDLYYALAEDLSTAVEDDGDAPKGWGSIVNTINDRVVDQKAASDALLAVGIRGIKYLDGGSRSDGDGSYNYVVFSGDDTKIERPMFSRQTDSPEFKKWFGDSKVVNGDGSPKVMYHGTRSQFDAFDNDKAGGLLYFSDSANTAAEYASGAGGNRRRSEPMFVHDETGQVYERTGDWEWTDLTGEKFDFHAMERLQGSGFLSALREGAQTMPVFLSAKNPLDLKTPEGIKVLAGLDDGNNRYAASVTRKAAEGRFDWGDTKNEAQTQHWNDILVPQLKERGYDGVRFRDDMHDTVAVFSPTQIKSAIGNSGAFDGSNPDVRFSRQGTAGNPPADPLRGGLIDKLGQVLGGKALSEYLLQPARDRLIRGAKRIIPNAIQAGFVSDYGLDSAYLDVKDTTRAQTNAQLRKTKSLIDMLQGLDREQSRIAYQWMTEKPDKAMEARMIAALPEASRGVLRNMKQMIHDLGKQAVALGLLSEETFKLNEYSYLHRSYLKHEAEGKGAAGWKANAQLRAENFKKRGLRDDVARDKLPATLKVGDKLERFLKRDSLGRIRQIQYSPPGKPPAGFESDGIWTARFTDKRGQVGMWRDLTKDERLKLGEIEEVRYAMAKTVLGAVRDIENARFLRWVATRYGKDPATVDAKPASAGYLLNQAFAEGDWVEVPSTKIAGTQIKRFGALAGMAVPGPVWNDLRSEFMNRPEGPFASAYDWTLRAWKLAKTGLSPAVHMNNVMSNFVMADMADVRLRDMAQAMTVLLKAKRGDRDSQGLIERYKDSGAEDGSLVAQELKVEIMEEILQDLQGQNDEDIGKVAYGSIVSLLAHREWSAAFEGLKTRSELKLARFPFEKMVQAYQAEDSFFRLAAFLQKVREGESDLAAGKHARDAFLNYRINAPWIQSLRRSALPFIAFPYRAIPKVLNTAVEKPWKIAKYVGLGMGLNAAAYAMLGLSGDDEDRERKLLPEEKQGKMLGIFPRLLRMPWNDEHGSPVFLDVRRWVPAGDMFDVSQSQAATPLPSWLSAGGPVALGMELMLNKSSFTGKPIVLKTDDPGESMVKITDHLFKFFSPNLPVPNPIGWAAPGDMNIPGAWQTYSWTSIENAGKGVTDAFGRERNLEQALLSSVGVKVGSYPRDVAIQNSAFEYRQKRDEIRKQLYDIGRQQTRGGLTDEDAALKQERQRDKLRRINERLQERSQ